jgi:hypothetical protein
MTLKRKAICIESHDLTLIVDAIRRCDFRMWNINRAELSIAVKKPVLFVARWVIKIFSNALAAIVYTIDSREKDTRGKRNINLFELLPLTRINEAMLLIGYKGAYDFIVVVNPEGRGIGGTGNSNSDE